MLTALFDEMMQAERAEDACPRFCPALTDYWERVNANLWAAQQAMTDRHNLRPEP